MNRHCFTPLPRVTLATAVALICLFSLAALPAAAERLADTVRPTRYTLTLTPDLKAATFRGDESIDVTLAEPTSQIALNAVEIAFQSVTVTADGTEQTAAVTLDKE